MDLVLARHAKVGDDGAPDVLDQLVTAAGVPVLVLPPEASEATSATNDHGRLERLARGGTRRRMMRCRSCARAKRMILCAVGEEADASLDPAAAMLRRHGVAVQPQPIDEPDGDAGEILLAQAAAHGADLLVMGAYGHARLRELVFGGATRHVLRAGNPAGALRQLTLVARLSRCATTSRGTAS